MIAASPRLVKGEAVNPREVMDSEPVAMGRMHGQARGRLRKRLAEFSWSSYSPIQANLGQSLCPGLFRPR